MSNLTDLLWEESNDQKKWTKVKNKKPNKRYVRWSVVLPGQKPRPIGSPVSLNINNVPDVRCRCIPFPSVEKELKIIKETVVAHGLKDSGERVREKSGAVREPDYGRGWYELLPPEAIRRLCVHYEMGGRKYTPRNWELGLPYSRTIRSTLRHLFQWLEGNLSEDHLAAAAWGCFALMTFEKSHPEMNDIPARLKAMGISVSGK